MRGDQDWSALERKLLDTCQSGVFAELDDKADLPKDTDDPDRRIRPALIRYLMLGGCDSSDDDSRRPHAKGVMIAGGWIDGALDLESCHSPLDLKLVNCLFPNGLNLRDADIGGLYLPGSRAEELANLHRLKTETDVHLRNGFHASAGVNLGGARIGGQVDCGDGKFINPNGDAINLAAATVGADVFLSGPEFRAEGLVDLVRFQVVGQVDCTDGKFINPAGDAINLNAATVGASVLLRGTEFRAEGLVNLPHAQISGQVSCVGGRFENEHGPAIIAEGAVIGADMFLYGARVTGSIDMTRIRIAGGMACQRVSLDGPLKLNAAEITQSLQWQNVKGKIPICDLRNAHVGTLIDDADSWARVDSVQLGGFRYDRLENLLSTRKRINWLSKNTTPPIERTPTGKTKIRSDPPGFNPGPWSQLAGVLDQMGQRSMAVDLRYERDKRQHATEYQRGLSRLESGRFALPHRIRWVFGWVYRYLFGYGHKPMWAMYFVGGVIAFAALLYGAAYNAHQMAPNSDVILTSQAWQKALAAGCGAVDWNVVGWDWTAPINQDCVMPLQLWSENALEVADYETFHPVLYAVDLFVPLDALGQETTWAPARDRGWLGWFAYAMRMPIQMSGWIITAVGAAVLTGLVGRKD